MSYKAVLEIVKQAELLPPEEQLNLIALLASRMRRVYRPGTERRRWCEICGAANYPLAGMDAQVWVSNARREGDENRAYDRETFR